MAPENETRADKRETLRALLYLREEAIEERGWMRRGVRGWRFYHEIEWVTESWLPDRLPPLVRGGMLDCIAVRDPGRTWARYLYRVTQRGIEYLAGSGHAPHVVISAPAADDPAVSYLPQPSWDILVMLRRDARKQRGRLRHDTYGWLTTTELRHRVSEELETRFVTGLIERGLIQAESLRGGRIRIYAATKQGLSVRLVDGTAGVGPYKLTMVQVQLPEDET